MPIIQLSRVTKQADAPSLVEIGLIPELREGAISSGDTNVSMGDVDYTGQIVVRRATGRTVRQSMTMTAGSLQSLDVDKGAIQRFP